MPGPSEIEIRPFYELEDFADVMTPEQAERGRADAGGVGGAVTTACCNLLGVAHIIPWGVFLRGIIYSSGEIPYLHFLTLFNPIV